MKRIHLVMAGIAVLVLAAVLAVVSSNKSATVPDQPPATTAAAPAAQPATNAPSNPQAPPAEAGANTRLSAPNKPAPPQHKPPKPAEEYPTARALPDREGFVLSPYTNKIIDVRGLPSGTLVADPEFSTQDKKFFRVP